MWNSEWAKLVYTQKDLISGKIRPKVKPRDAYRERQKGRDLIQSYDKSHTPTEMSKKGKVTTQTMPHKSSITQRLRTDLGRSVGVITATNWRG